MDKQRIREIVREEIAAHEERLNEAKKAYYGVRIDAHALTKSVVDNLKPNTP